MTLNVQILHIQRVVFDEFTPRFDLVAHEDGEDAVGFDGVFDADLEHGAFFGVDRRFPELFRVHLAKALVTLYGGLLAIAIIFSSSSHKRFESFPTGF